MSRAPWPLVELAARLLERQEREAVLGDLTESGDNTSQAIFGVLGLAARRNAELWKAWQPWVGAFGLALPASFLLMGASVSVSSTYERLFDAKNFGACAATGNEGYWLLLCHVLLLAGWSWTSGFVVGMLSRRTLWSSALLSLLPCLFCLTRFRIAFLSKYSLLLFLAPAIAGVWQGVHGAVLKYQLAIALAGAMTALMAVAYSERALWILNWALVWPAWYLVAAAQKPTWLKIRTNGCD